MSQPFFWWYTVTCEALCHAGKPHLGFASAGIDGGNQLNIGLIAYGTHSKFRPIYARECLLRASPKSHGWHPKNSESTRQAE